MSVLLKSLLDRFSLDRGASKEKWAIHHGGAVSSFCRFAGQSCSCEVGTAVMFVSLSLLANRCHCSLEGLLQFEDATEEGGKVSSDTRHPMVLPRVLSA